MTSLPTDTPSCRVVAFYSRDTRHFCYVVSDTHSGHCAIVDPSANYLACSGGLSFDDANTVLKYIQDQSLCLKWILETDIHTSHFSAASYLRSKLGGKLLVSAQVEQLCGRLRSCYPDFSIEPGDFDGLLKNGQSLALGELSVMAMAIPGRSPAAMAFLVDNCLFPGDSLLMPDNGPACACSPLADHDSMRHSLAIILQQTDTVRVFVGRDSDSDARSLEYETTVAALRETATAWDIPTGNCRRQRQYGAELCPLFWPALQWNLSAQLPRAGMRRLWLPLRIEE